MFCLKRRGKVKKPQKDTLPPELQHHGSGMTPVFNQVRNDCCDEWEAFLPHKEEIIGLVGQVYCTKRNDKKIVDPDLLMDIVEIIAKRIGK